MNSLTVAEKYLHFFLVQRDISGAEDLTITSEYGGKVCEFIKIKITHIVAQFNLWSFVRTRN